MRRVALKIALAAGAAAAVAAWLCAVVLLDARAGAAALVATVSAAGACAAAFLSVTRLIGHRLRYVGSVLDELLDEGSRHAGEDSVADDSPDHLVRQSDRALHAVRKREAELNRTDTYRREYVGDVSHEIKTPVFAIRGFAETLLNGALNDPSVNRAFVEKIYHHADRLGGLAHDLSEVSRLETGQMKLVPAPFAVAALMEEVRDILDIAAREKGVVVRLDAGRADVAAEGDRARIGQVLTNLLDNAIQYTDPGGWVELSAAQIDSNIIRVAVKDSGIGIEPQDIDRITERFYRTEKSRSRSRGGTGLGLSIVKHLLAAHGSALQVESQVGVGSTFSFTLPAAKEGRVAR